MYDKIHYNKKKERKEKKKPPWFASFRAGLFKLYYAHQSHESLQASGSRVSMFTVGPELCIASRVPGLLVHVSGLCHPLINEGIEGMEYTECPQLIDCDFP